MSWQKLYEQVAPFVVKIETPAGMGTGFAFAFNNDGSLIAIATALHIVREADDWRQPIRLSHQTSGSEAFLNHGARAVLSDYQRDSAAIVMASDALKLPNAALPLVPKDKFKKVGTGVAWVGYPALAPTRLCFFQGGISAWVADDDSYFIDGVAINGVSGGPVFTEVGESPQIVGIISAYFPNMQRQGALPGLLKAHDVTHLHNAIGRIRSVDDAARQAAEERKGRPEPAASAQEPRPASEPVSVLEPAPAQEPSLQPAGPR